MISSRQRFAFWTILAGGFTTAIAEPGAIAALNTLRMDRPVQEKIARKTTDPPVVSEGRLGQDLFLAIDHRDLGGVRALLKQGADPNSRNGLEFTPLYVAAGSGQPEVMEALLQGGAKLEAASPYGTALTFAINGGNIPGIHLLLARGADIHASRSDGLTSLALACRGGAVEIVGELLHRKAKVNDEDSDGATPLSFAAREGHTEVGRLLLGAGASIDGADSHHWTPLMYAAVNGHVEFVRLLLDKGANPNAREANGRTPLLLAATYGGSPEVISALLKGGADPRATDTGARTAREWAALRGYDRCAGLLGDTTASLPSLRLTPEKAVLLSLKTVQHAMLQFNRNTGCVSCHHEGLGRMTTGAARDRGFTLDQTADRAELERVNAVVNTMSPLHIQALKDPGAMKNVPLIEIEEVTSAYTFILAGMAAHRQPATHAAGAMAMVLARQQLPAGNWRFAIPRVPMQSSFFTFTALAIEAMQAYGPRANAPEIAERIHRAKAWLVTAPTTTSEDRTFRLLGLKWSGASEQERQKAVDELRAEQRPDGGWPQLSNLQSDAYATGQALYALHVAGGLPTRDPLYQRGIRFLLRTQDEDGSWFVNKRAMPANNYIDAGFPHGESQYASFNGTCWATLALLQTIDHPQ